MIANLRRWAPSAVMAVILLALSAPAIRADNGADAAPPAATAADAVRDTVTGLGGVYAGDCAAVQSPRDTGKTCSTLIAERGRTRAYLAGRVASEFSTWVFVRPAVGGWSAVATAPVDMLDQSNTVPWPAGT